MTEIDSLSIKITASTTEAEAAIDRLATKMNSLTTSYGGQSGNANKSTQNLNKNLNSTNKTVKRAKTSWGGLASVIGRFYASCFLAIRGVKALGNSIQSTADYFEAFNYFNVALGKIGKDSKDSFTEELGKELGIATADEYAKSFATRLQDKLQDLSGLQITDSGTLDTTGMKNLGLNIQEITQFSAQLASVTNSVGQVGEVSLATSSAFTKLASDMSSLFNIDYSQVATNLQSGLIGQSRALYKYGIDITNATLQTYAYELGIEKAVSEMTQAEKMQLRLIAILNQSRVSWGDQANTINSLANQMRILENNMSEISLVLGQLFVPLMENALPVVNGLTRAIKNLLVNLAGILGIEIDPGKFGKGFTEIEDNFEGITEGTEEAEKALEEYKNQLLGFDEVNKLQDVDAKATFDTEQGEGFDITQEILDATEEYEKFWQEAFAGMEDYATKWEKYFSKIIEPLKNFFEVIGKKGSNGIGEALGGFVSETAQKFNKFLSSSIDKIDWGELARKFVTEFVDFVVALSPVELAGSFNALGNSLTSAIVKALINGVSQTILETPRFIAGLVGIDVDFGIDETALQSGVSASALALSKEIKDLVENYQDLRDARIVSFENSIVEYSYLENLKNRYFDLAEETNRDITKEQELQALRELIIKEYPDFAEILNDTKLSYEEQEKAIDDIISALKKKAKVEAAQEILVEIEKERLKLQKQIDKYDKEALETGQEKYKEAQELRAEYDKNKETIDELGRAMEQAFQDMDMQLYYDLEEQQAELIEQNEKLVPQIAGLIDEYSLLTSGYNQLVREMDGLNAEFDYYLGQASGVINSTDNIRDSINKLSQTASTAGNNFGTIFAEQLAKSVKSKMALEDFVSVGEQIAKDLGKGLMKANGYDYRLDIEVDSVEGFINFKNKWGIGAYATGGFPEDGLFFANHNELVGKFANGRPAVVNNYQIEDGIENASYRGMARALAEHQVNGGTVNVVLQGDADNLFRVVQSKADNYTMQTGRPAFII